MGSCSSCSKLLGCGDAARFGYNGCRDFTEVTAVPHRDLELLFADVSALPDGGLTSNRRSDRRAASKSSIVVATPQHKQDELDLWANEQIVKLLAGIADAEAIIEKYEAGDNLHISLSEYEGAMDELLATAAEYTKLLAVQMDKDVFDAVGQLDDSDFPRAANVYDFMIGSSYLAMSPYAAQLLFALLVMEDYCPDCSNLDYFHNYKVNDSYATVEDNICILEFGVCPECGRNKTDFLQEGKHKFYTDLALMLGQRSGKSYLIVALFAFMTHYILKLQNPQVVLGVDATSALVSTVCSAKLLQAKNAMFKPLLSQMAVSPWFQDYGEFLRVSRKKNGRELFALNETSIRFRHRNFDILLEAANGETLRGPTRVNSAIDEFAHISDADPDSVLSATQVYTALRNSLKTIHGSSFGMLKAGVRHDLYPPAQFNLSSCCHARDPMVRQIARAKINPQILAITKATWEVNPKLPRSSFDGDYLDNPVEAARNYGSIPPATNSPFFSNIDLVKNSARKYPVIKVPIRIGRGRMFKQAVTQARVLDLSDLEAPPGRSCITLDAGLNNNSFAVAMHAISEDDFASYPYAFIEVPPIAPNVPIDFNYLTENLIIPLARWSRARYLIADRWNSIHLLQTAITLLTTGDNAQPCEYYQISLKFDDLVKMQARIQDGSAILPLCPGPDDPFIDFAALGKYADNNYPHGFHQREVEHFYFQMMTIRRIGKTCLKGEGLTDDLFRAYAVGEYFLHHNDDCKLEMLNNSEVEQVATYQPMAAIITKNSAKTSSPTVGNIAPSFSFSRRK